MKHQNHRKGITVASSLNKCCFIGNLGADVETRYLPSGDALASFTIACTEKWKDKASGEMKEQTEWVRCSVFGRLAEVCSEYLKKGSKVYIEGKFKTRKYQAQDGTDRYTTEIKVDEMIMLDGRPAGDGNSGNGGNSGSGYSRERTSGGQRNERPAGTKAGSAGQSRHQGGGPSGGFDEMDDDIPFSPPYRGMQLLSCA